MTKDSYAVSLSRAWHFAERWDWNGMERILNPKNAFKCVHIVSFNDAHDYSIRRHGTLLLHILPGKGKKILRFPLLNSLRVAQAFRRLVRQYNVPLLVDSYGNVLDNGLPTVLAGKWTGIPTLVTVQNDYHQMFKAVRIYLKSFMINNMLERVVYRSATHIRCVRPSLVNYVKEHGISEGKISYLPRAFDLATFSEPTATDKEQFRKKFDLDSKCRETIALCVAKMSPQKNLKRLLRAFAEATLYVPHLNLWMVGSGEQEKELRLLSTGLGIEKKIQFFSSLPQRELRCAYGLSHFLVLPSLFEGLPRVVVEALYYGLPVISSNIPGVVELVKDNFNGLLVNPKRIDDIALGLIRLAIDKRFYVRLSKNAPCIVHERFMGEAIWEKEANLYKTLIKNYQKDVDLVKAPWN